MGASLAVAPKAALARPRLGGVSHSSRVCSRFRSRSPRAFTAETGTARAAGRFFAGTAVVMFGRALRLCRLDAAAAALVSGASITQGSYGVVRGSY
jgi:hypothetical protein